MTNSMQGNTSVWVSKWFYTREEKLLKILSVQLCQNSQCGIRMQKLIKILNV